MGGGGDQRLVAGREREKGPGQIIAGHIAPKGAVPIKRDLSRCWSPKSTVRAGWVPYAEDTELEDGM